MKCCFGGDESVGILVIVRVCLGVGFSCIFMCFARGLALVHNGGVLVIVRCLQKLRLFPHFDTKVKMNL